MRMITALMMPLAVAVAMAAAPTDGQNARSVPDLDLARYAGRWHEIARFPNRFQKQCLGDVTAEYVVGPDGRITVINACRIAGGGIDRAEGVAKKADANGPASRLKVRFAPAFLSFLPMVWGDYWVIALPSDYRYAVVGSPDHAYLWILSRTPAMSDADYAEALAAARANGFDVTKVEKTPPFGPQK